MALPDTAPSVYKKEAFATWLREQATSEQLEAILRDGNPWALQSLACEGPLEKLPASCFTSLVKQAPRSAPSLLAHRTDLPQPWARALFQHGISLLGEKQYEGGGFMLSSLLEASFQGRWPNSCQEELREAVIRLYSQNKYSPGSLASSLLLQARTGLTEKTFKTLWERNRGNIKLLGTLICHPEAPCSLLETIARESNSHPRLMQKMASRPRTASLIGVREAIFDTGNVPNIQRLLATAPEPGFNRLLSGLLIRNPEAATELVHREPNLVQQHLSRAALKGALSSETSEVREAALRISSRLDLGVSTQRSQEAVSSERSR